MYGAVLQSLDELGESSQWLYYDDSTIIIDLVTTTAVRYYYNYFRAETPLELANTCQFGVTIWPM